MAKRKCLNAGCVYNDEDVCLYNKQIGIDNHGCCDKYKKGVIYYLAAVGNAMGESNIIPIPNLTDEVRIGIYMMMRIYGLLSVEWGHGYWVGVGLVKEEGGKHLTFEEAMFSEGFNSGEYEKINEEILTDSLPKVRHIESEEEIDYKSYGFLSPNGDFTPGEWGTHEELAFNIVDKLGLEDERCEKHIHLCRDFLINEKGYVLIHDPSNQGYIVTHGDKPLTKKQKDFLYGYFLDMGDKFNAEKYFEED